MRNTCRSGLMCRIWIPCRGRDQEIRNVLEIVPVSLISGSMLLRVWRIMLASATELAMMTKSSMNRRSSSAWICWLIRMLQAFLSMVPMKMHAKTPGTRYIDNNSTNNLKHETIQRIHSLLSLSTPPIEHNSFTK